MAEHTTDPVCGMHVDAAHAAARTEHAGDVWLFCSTHCRDRFVADPARFTAPAASAPASVHDHDRPYTCPMHPEVRQQGPGHCPICGMALEPVVASREDEASDEERDMERRFRVAAWLTAPIVLGAMVEMIAPAWWHGVAPASAWSWLQFALAAPVVAWAGAPLHARAVASVRALAPNMFTLIGLGVAAAFAWSIVALLAPDLGGVSAAHPPLYFEAAAAIVALTLLGQVLELRARRRTGDAIRSLLALAPETARRLEQDGSERDVPLAEVRVGDRLRVRPGDRVPVDGFVLEGHSAVDEALLTGEPLPIEKRIGDTLTAGTTNGTGALIMQAQYVGAATTLARIVALVAKAQRSRAPIQGLADRVAAVFVPAVIAVALVTFVLWWLLAPGAGVGPALANSIAVLIIACPCALGLATPMSIMVGIGRGATMGILVRDAAALQELATVDTILLDKTGTLTAGKPRLVAIETAAHVDQGVLLAQVAAVELASEHPLATAVVAAARERGIEVAPAASFEAVPGHGVRGTVRSVAVAVGSLRWLAEAGAEAGPFTAAAEQHRAHGRTVVAAAVAGQVAGLLAIEDVLRPTSRDGVAALQALGLRVVMATGDARTTAAAVAKELQIEHVEAEVSPQQKAEIVAALRTQGRRIAMIGDGINDAVALASAHVGIAMGTGSDVAIDSAGVMLARDDLRAIAGAIRLARSTQRNIRQNLAFAFGYNLLGVPVAAGLLHPFTGWLMSPMLASAAMSLSSVCVIGNALRLRRAPL